MAFSSEIARFGPNLGVGAVGGLPGGVRGPGRLLQDRMFGASSQWLRVATTSGFAELLAALLVPAGQSLHRAAAAMGHDAEAWLRRLWRSLMGQT